MTDKQTTALLRQCVNKRCPATRGIVVGREGIFLADYETEVRFPNLVEAQEGHYSPGMAHLLLTKPAAKYAKPDKTWLEDWRKRAVFPSVDTMDDLGEEYWKDRETVMAACSRYPKDDKMRTFSWPCFSQGAMVATDGQRLHAIRKDYAPGMENVILATTGNLGALVQHKLIKGGKFCVGETKGHKMFFWTDGVIEVSIVVPNLQQFPDWPQVIPKLFPGNYTPVEISAELIGEIRKIPKNEEFNLGAVGIEGFPGAPPLVTAGYLIDALDFVNTNEIWIADETTPLRIVAGDRDAVVMCRGWRQ